MSLYKKTELGKCKKLLDVGYSLLTVGENKVPNFPWKSKQTTPYTKEAFEKDYNYQSGIYKKNGEEIKATGGVGIITGYNGIEVIDIDLKILPTLKEQQDFWKEYLGFLKDNIDDFDSKFVIYKTINNGYHILYKCATIDGNKKIAKLKGHTEAIIETRGIGGYVFIYENKVSQLSYYDIKEISELDRDALWGCSKYYDYVEEKDTLIPKTESREINIDVSVWDDYNQKTSIMDVVGNELSIVKNLSDKLIIKRNNADSAHSGYVYKNSGCMYLFSTGTIYPSEKLISPYSAYTIKYHNGDYSAAAKDLYKQGFGSRVVSKPKQIEEIKETLTFNKDDLVFPIDIFPSELQNYMILCNKTLDSSLDYMGCSLLWSLSVIIGNSIHVQVKRGWNESASVWISVVGQAGIGKTPSISNMVFPLMKSNNREIKNYSKEISKYNEYKELSKKEKEDTEEIKKPVKTQFIADDITLEALIEMHEENKNSVGVFKDELAGWLKDMNKYREGSDLEFWLSSWSGKSVALNRKTAKSSFVERPMVPVLGGIQPSVLDAFYTEENKDNGFIDRMLLCFPDLKVEKYNESEIDQSTIDWYSDYLIHFYDGVRRHIVQYNIDDEIEPHIARFSDDARNEWKRIFNEITDLQNSDEENEYMKSMLPKQKSYIPRFALLINTIVNFDNGDSNYTEISKESILAAERLSKYFVAMAKKIKISSSENNDLKKIIGQNTNKTTFEKFAEVYKVDKELNRTTIANVLGVSRQTVNNYIKKLEKV